MNKYQHPKHEDIANGIKSGHSDRGIAEALKVDRRAVARTRKILGVPPIDTSKTLTQKVLDHVTPADSDGHVLWTGSRTSCGAPRVRHLGREIPVSHIAFETRTGRKPVGIVKADCGVRGCVAGTHVVDDVERRAIRLLMRSMTGYPVHWQDCPTCGLDWNTVGRVQENLELYCKDCVGKRVKANREDRKAKR